MKPVDLIHASVAAQVYAQDRRMWGHEAALRQGVEAADAFVAGYTAEMAKRTPPYVSADELDDEPTEDLADEPATFAELGAQVFNEPAPKRGRGRPRKNPTG
jgi:hypothetical protein